MLDEKYKELKEIREKISDFQKKETELSNHIRDYFHKNGLTEVTTKYGIIRLINVEKKVLDSDLLDKSKLPYKSVIFESIRLIKP